MQLASLDGPFLSQFSFVCMVSGDIGDRSNDCEIRICVNAVDHATGELHDKSVQRIYPKLRKGMEMRLRTFIEI